MILLTLGVETSGRSGAVALRRDGQTVEVVPLEQAGRRHAQTLISEVEALLRRHGLTPQQLELLAVSIGPGSFTGLRVGVVFAKTWAYTTGCRLVGVDTLHAVAMVSPDDVTAATVVADAQRGEVFVGHYVRNSHPSDGNNGLRNSWQREHDVSIQSVDRLCRDLATRQEKQAPWAITGPAVELLQPHLPSTMRVLDLEHRHPRADVVAELGEQLALAGVSTDPWTLEPYYLRRSAAEEKAAANSSLVTQQPVQ